MWMLINWLQRRRTFPYGDRGSRAPGAAEAVKQSGRADVKVIGQSLPSLCRPYVHAGIIDAVSLCNTYDVGYLTVHVAHRLARGRLKAGATSLEAGRAGLSRFGVSVLGAGAAGQKARTTPTDL